MSQLSLEEEEALIQVAIYLSLEGSVFSMDVAHEESTLIQHLIIDSLAYEKERKDNEQKEIQEFYQKMLTQKMNSWEESQEENEKEYEIIILDNETD